MLAARLFATASILLIAASHAPAASAAPLDFEFEGFIAVAPGSPDVLGIDGSTFRLEFQLDDEQAPIAPVSTDRDGNSSAQYETVGIVTRNGVESSETIRLTLQDFVDRPDLATAQTTTGVQVVAGGAPPSLSLRGVAPQPFTIDGVVGEFAVFEMGVLGRYLSTSTTARARYTRAFAERISIVARREDRGDELAWRFRIEAEGHELSTASVTPPSGGALALSDPVGNGATIEYESEPFETFAGLQAVHPPGDYALLLATGDSVTLAWNPTEPLGSAGQPTLSIDAPRDGEADVDREPAVEYSLDCGNCRDLRLEIQDVATRGRLAHARFDQVDPQGGFLEPIPYESTDAARPLPNGEMTAELAVGFAEVSSWTFLPGTETPPFQYREAAELFAQSTFSVGWPCGLMVARDVGGLAKFFFDGDLDGIADGSFALGPAGSEVLVGAWDGVADRVAVRREVGGLGKIFFDTNGDPFVEKSYVFGQPDDPIASGDWNGDGKETLVVQRAVGGLAKYAFDDGEGNAFKAFVFGGLDDQLVVGDWDGDGDDNIGVIRLIGGRYQWNLNTTGGAPAEIPTFHLGEPPDRPIVGDWNGDGADDVGIVRLVEGSLGKLRFLLDFDRAPPWEARFDFGNTADTVDSVVVCDWDEDGGDNVGVSRVDPAKNALRWIVDTSNSNTRGTELVRFGEASDPGFAGSFQSVSEP